DVSRRVRAARVRPESVEVPPTQAHQRGTMPRWWAWSAARRGRRRSVRWRLWRLVTLYGTHSRASSPVTGPFGNTPGLFGLPGRAPWNKVRGRDTRLPG